MRRRCGMRKTKVIEIYYKGVYRKRNKVIKGLLFIYRSDIEELAKEKLKEGHDFDEVEILDVKLAGVQGDDD